MKRMMLGIFFIIIVVAVIPGCGEETETNGVGIEEEATPDGAAISADLPDPCVLLTKADIESVLGVTVGEPERSDVSGLRSCDYFAEDGEAFGLAIQRCDEDEFDFLKSGEPVEGLGEEADWDEFFNNITVRTRDDLCLITGASVEDEPDVALEKTERLARIALERLE
ncbi:MAG: hypothetical protein IBX61_07520 [Thermoleophilia bacterium]|nr:hypothetical protein [Thermoleophilia bacterium]